MLGIIFLLVLMVLIAFPGFFIITRKMFPRGPKKTAAWISAGLTTILVLILLGITLGAGV